MFKYLDKLALNKGLMLLLCSIALALACVELCVAVKKGKLQARLVVTTACKALLAAACAYALGFLVALLPLSGLWASVVFYALLAVVLAAVVIVYVAGERKQVRLATANALRKSAGNTAAVRHAKGWIFGVCFTLTVGAALLLAIGSERFYLPMVPVALAVVVILLHAIVRWRIWYALAAIAIAAFGAMILVMVVSASGAQLAPLAVASFVVATTVPLVAGFITLTLRRE